MPLPHSDLSDPLWTADLARQLERAAAAIARLDARVCASSVATAWRYRAAWAGCAAALQLQGEEIDEVDLFARECAIPLPQRPRLAALAEPLEHLADLRALCAPRPAAHWREALPFAFEPPVGWAGRPALLRLLELTRLHARADPSALPWLTVPQRMQELGMCHGPLPCLVAGEKALRLGGRSPDDLTRGFLKVLRQRAEDGLGQLDRLERYRDHSAQIAASMARPGALPRLTVLMLRQPALSPKAAAEALGITLSGAGKLLERAQAVGLLHELSGRQSWRIYLVRDLAERYGFVKPPLGRPPAPPAPSRDLDAVLAQFDQEMAEIDIQLSEIGSAAGV